MDPCSPKYFYTFLFTYERALFGQAKTRKFLILTNERKKMSTKTTFKRIALVAVAALGAGVLSVAPASAGELPGSQVTAVTVAKETASPTVGSAVFVKFGATFAALTAAAGNNADSTQFRAAITAFPAGGSVAITSNTAANATPAGTATPVAVTAGTAPTTAATAGTNEVTVTLAAEDTTAWSAQTLTYLAGFNFTPTKAGVYEVTVWRDTDDADDIDVSEVRNSVSITVAAAATYSNTLSTAFSQGGTATSAPTAATSALAVNQSATKSADNRMSILVALNDSSNTAMTSGNTLSAEISGPGYLTWANEAVDNTSNCSVTPTISATTGRSISTAVDASSALYVCSDGTAGVSTVTIKVTDAADNVYTLATKSLTFFGSVKTIKATGVLTVARAAGASATGTSVADRDLATETPAVIVYATDANGNPVTGLTITAKSSSTTVMSETLTVNEDVKSSANIYSSGGAGYYNISVTGSTGSKSGD